MRLHTNQNAYVAWRNMAIASGSFSKSMERLSSGLRISRAADDAAGLALAEKLRAQRRGLARAQENARDGINAARTADGALSQIHEMLQRMRELTIQASSETLTAGDLLATNAELQQLRAEIDRMHDITEFNGKKLLVGTSVTTPVTTTTVSLAGTSALTPGATVTGTTPPMVTAVAGT